MEVEDPELLVLEALDLQEACQDQSFYGLFSYYQLILDCKMFLQSHHYHPRWHHHHHSYQLLHS